MLNDSQLRRYARNISLPQIGVSGQEKLLAAKVLVVGAGGLGSPVISYLTAAGIAHIGIADYDRVELSNLQRQTLFETADIGRLKTEAARDRAQELNPDVQVTLHSEKLNAENIDAVVRQYDVVADGCDNFVTRFAVNESCLRLQKPLISAAVRAFDGQLALFKPYSGSDSPCYRCFVGSHPDDERGCSDVGVLGALTGAMGSLQAMMIIKELLGLAQKPGELFLLDGITLSTRQVKIQKDPECPSCRV